MDAFAVGLTEQIIKWRWLVIALSFALAIGVVSNARFLTFGNDYRVFFSDENPELAAFEALQETYTKNDNMFFMVRHRDGGDVFR
ncbi:MAG: RND transporter, partial [Pseudomonadota bacterium]